MPNEAIDQLFRTPVCWLTDGGPEDDIAISSRIRLARNVAGEAFPIRSTDPALCAVRDSVLDALRGIAAEQELHTSEFLVDELSELDRRFLLERHLISREFINPKAWRGAGDEPGPRFFCHD